MEEHYSIELTNRQLAPIFIQALKTDGIFDPATGLFVRIKAEHEWEDLSYETRFSLLRSMAVAHKQCQRFFHSIISLRRIQ